MGKRIALCLSGIVGGIDGPDGKGDMVDLHKIFNQYKKHILDLNDVDVFLHSWSTDVEDIVCDLYKPKSKKPLKKAEYGISVLGDGNLLEVCSPGIETKKYVNYILGEAEIKNIYLKLEQFDPPIFDQSRRICNF